MVPAGSRPLEWILRLLLTLSIHKEPFAISPWRITSVRSAKRETNKGVALSAFMGLVEGARLTFGVSALVGPWRSGAGWNTCFGVTLGPRARRCPVPVCVWIGEGSSLGVCPCALGLELDCNRVVWIAVSQGQRPGTIPAQAMGLGNRTKKRIKG